LRGVTETNSGCASVFIGLDGKPLGKKERAQLPRVTLWDRREKPGNQGWVVNIYRNPTIAKQIVKVWDGRSFLGRKVSFAREGNVVVMFSSPKSKQQVKDALSKL